MCCTVPSVSVTCFFWVCFGAAYVAWLMTYWMLLCLSMLTLCMKHYIRVWDLVNRTTCVPERTHRTGVQQNYTRGKEKMMANVQKEVQVKLTKGLLNVIVLQLLKNEPMHGYQVISQIRKSFGVYFGPSTVYPLLGTMEKKGYVASEWNRDTERPRKIYSLTASGQNLLEFTEGSLHLIVRNLPNTTPQATTTTIQTPLAPERTERARTPVLVH